MSDPSHPTDSADEDDAGEATLLLQRITDGDTSAGGALLRLLYGELRRVASGHMHRERGDHTLQPTALVHEAWVRLFDRGGHAYESRGHFLRLASRAMRNVLVDHARGRAAQKRGAGQERVALDDVLAVFEEKRIDVVALDEALERLAALDPELARIVEARFFAGLTIEETARALDTSASSVERGWRVARMWLQRDLRGGVDEG